MKQVTFLNITPKRRKYNDVVRKKLQNANIPYTEKDSQYGYRIMVNENNFSKANKIVLSISLYNPKY